jgi:hypothetical protein
MSELTPQELRTREANTHLKELLHAARAADESAVVLRHTSHNLASFDELNLHTTYIRALAERVIFQIDELTRKFEAGELFIEDFHFHMKADL